VRQCPRSKIAALRALRRHGLLQSLYLLDGTHVGHREDHRGATEFWPTTRALRFILFAIHRSQ
jgi:hypothetical protein